MEESACESSYSAEASEGALPSEASRMVEMPSGQLNSSGGNGTANQKAGRPILFFTAKKYSRRPFARRFTFEPNPILAIL